MKNFKKSTPILVKTQTRLILKVLKKWLKILTISFRIGLGVLYVLGTGMLGGGWGKTQYKVFTSKFYDAYII